MHHSDIKSRDDNFLKPILISEPLRLRFFVLMEILWLDGESIDLLSNYLYEWGEPDDAIFLRKDQTMMRTVQQLNASGDTCWSLMVSFLHFVF